MSSFQNEVIVKRVIALFLVFFPILGVAEDEGEEKIYIEPTQIGFSTRAIYVRLKDKWETISSVHADEGGLYIVKRMPPLPWTCPVCHAINGGNAPTCSTEGCRGHRPRRPYMPTVPPRTSAQESK